MAQALYLYCMASSKKTLVLGASANPSRYSYLAINRLRAHNHPVVAVGKRAGQVADVPIQTSEVDEAGIDTITLYLNPGNQEAYYDYILGLKPKRIIFNPGTENEDLMQRAEAQNIRPVIACTLVMLSTGQY
ncbi:MAG TPA: CoA-binding protein [Flavisolibacter sp.]|nr:CoA-binding protein [Flavisolibacter sp.]